MAVLGVQRSGSKRLEEGLRCCCCCYCCPRADDAAAPAAARAAVAVGVDDERVSVLPCSGRPAGAEYRARRRAAPGGSGSPGPTSHPGPQTP